MEKKEIEIITNYYYGIGQAQMIWHNKFEELDKNNNINKIYEIIDNDYNEKWYLIRDNNEKSYIMKYKCGNDYACEYMKKYQHKYNFFKITTELIKIFDNGIFPIVFKVNSDLFNNLYDYSKNISCSFFNNYYTFINDKYESVRVYRNKVEYETFKKEDEAIYWCSDFKITKEQAIQNNTKPMYLEQCIYNYEF